MTYLFCAALLLAGSAHAGELVAVSDLTPPDTPRKAYELLVGCSVVYAKNHATSRLTATELATAAVASCNQYADNVRDLAHRDAILMIERTLTPRQREVLAHEIPQKARQNAEDIRSDAIRRAKNEVLQALAESP